jgi:hypothetical protein
MVSYPEENAMSKLINGAITITLACALLLLSCSVSESSPPEPAIPGLVNTLAVQTLAARGITPLLSTPKPISVDPANTPAAELAHQAFPTQTPLSQNSANSIPFGSSASNLLPSSTNKCYDAAEFIKDISIPDDTALKPGEAFTKVWQVRNAGTCVWSTEYALIHVFGDAMNGITPSPLLQLVEPGQAVDIAIDLVAPMVPGMYQGDWMFQDSSGVRFGTGSNAREHIWVSIISGSPKLKAKYSNNSLNIPIFGSCGGGG